MLDWITTAEAIGATIAASAAIAVAVTQYCRANRLEIEVRKRVADVTKLSGRLDAIQAKRKPGPAARAKERQAQVAKTAQLIREITA